MTIKLFLVASVATLAMIFTAESKQPVPQQPRRIVTWLAILPPAIYDKPYTGRLMLQRFNDRNKLPCSKEAGLGCAHGPADHSWCYIALANDKLLASEHHALPEALRHELGHGNGWPGDHPDKRPTSRDSVKMPVIHKDIEYLQVDEPVCITTQLLKRCEPTDKWVMCLTPERKIKGCPRPVEDPVIRYVVPGTPGMPMPTARQ